MIAYGIYVVGASAWARATRGDSAGYVLAVLMSIDNFAYGAAHAAAGVGSAAHLLLLGAVSAAFAFAGLALGEIRRGAPERGHSRRAAMCLVLLVLVSLMG